jgi:hypothetical protein
MTHVSLEIPENQLVEWLKNLPTSTKKLALKAIVSNLDDLDELVDYGNERIRAICAERGIDWYALSEAEREQLIDSILHED